MAAVDSSTDLQFEHKVVPRLQKIITEKKTQYIYETFKENDIAPRSCRAPGLSVKKICIS